MQSDSECAPVLLYRVRDAEYTVNGHRREDYEPKGADSEEVDIFECKYFRVYLCIGPLWIRVRGWMQYPNACQLSAEKDCVISTNVRMTNKIFVAGVFTFVISHLRHLCLPVKAGQVKPTPSQDDEHSVQIFLYRRGELLQTFDVNSFEETALFVKLVRESDTTVELIRFWLSVVNVAEHAPAKLRPYDQSYCKYVEL